MRKVRTYEIKIPAVVDVRDGDDGLIDIWLDGDVYDGIAVPKHHEAKAMALIKKHGTDWVHHMPKEWWAT